MRLTPERNRFPTIYFVHNDHLLIFHAVGQENLYFHGTVIRFQVCLALLHKIPLPPPPLFSFCPWHSRWWAFWKNSDCFSPQLSFVSSEHGVLLCHFQGLFETLDHSWRFNQEFTPWRSWRSGSLTNSVEDISSLSQSSAEHTFHFVAEEDYLIHKPILTKNINNLPAS